MPRFETHSHSWFSNIRLLDSINNPKDLILTAAKLGYKGIALTDHEALCGAVQWLKLEKELKKEEKIPTDFCCALGNEIYLTETRDKFLLISVAHWEMKFISPRHEIANKNIITIF